MLFREHLQQRWDQEIPVPNGTGPRRQRRNPLVHLDRIGPPGRLGVRFHCQWRSAHPMASIRHSRHGFLPGSPPSTSMRMTIFGLFQLGAIFRCWRLWRRFVRARRRCHSATRLGRSISGVGSLANDFRLGWLSFVFGSG